jgi:hypothetical protein
MWRSVLLAVVLAGALAGCSSTSDAPATANSTPVGSSARAKPADIASLRQCLVGHGATVSAGASRRWRIAFADGYSMAFTVPKPGAASLQTVFLSPDNSTSQDHDLQGLIACYRQAFG